MPTLLDFQRDPKELRDLDADPMTADAGDLTYILLRQRIDLTVGDARVLDRKLVPLFFLACPALNALRNLSSQRHVQLEIPEGAYRLSFDLSEDRVRVREDYRGVEGEARYDDLLQVWEEFNESARDYLLTEFPGLLDHPEVGGWFRKDPNWWDEYFDETC